jgi:putative ABC transport system permease protein
MLKNYFKIAIKVLRRRKFFTFISLFAISFTLVVLMLASAILDHMFAPMAPETRQDRTLGIFRAALSGPHDEDVSEPGFKLLDKYMRTLPDVEATSIYTTQRVVSMYKDDYDLQPYFKGTDGDYWRILNFTFLEGGPYTVEDDKNANFVAVIDEAMKEKLYGGEPAVGKYFEADRQRFRVVGVVANVPIFRNIPFSDIWVPLSTRADQDYREKIQGDCNGLILAHSAADFPKIKDEFAARMKTVELPSKVYTKLECIPGTTFDEAARDFLGTPTGHDTEFLIAFIIVAAFLFMLLPTVNLINLNISRMIERASEIGVRKSFGASSKTLVGQFLVENIILTFIGGVIGFVLSTIILQIITTSGLIAYAEFHLNLRLFFYAFGLIVFFGLLSGVYPAWKMSRLQPVNALKGIVR